jgi:hypothetical protein
MGVSVIETTYPFGMDSAILFFATMVTLIVGEYLYIPGEAQSSPGFA